MEDRRIDIILVEVKKIQEILKGDDYLKDGGVIGRLDRLEDKVDTHESYKHNIAVYLALFSIPSLFGIVSLIDKVSTWVSK
jgi:hypothetical protein